MELLLIFSGVAVLFGLFLLVLFRPSARPRRRAPLPDDTAARPVGTVPRRSATHASNPPPSGDVSLVQRAASGQAAVRVLVTGSAPASDPDEGIAAQQDGSKCWVPPGTPVRVGQWTLPRGACYIGSRLAAARAWVSTTEPALIDPRLPAEAKADPRLDHGMGYWPAYDELSPTARGAYLNWLSAATFDPAANIGLVFLFFYGLERRALVDTKATPAADRDLRQIRQLVRDLRKVYAAHNGSFAHYSAAFLALLDSRRVQAGDGPPPAEALLGRSDAAALRVRIGLGLRIRAGIALDANWALAWVRTDPEISLRLPATRCIVEFNQVFAARFGACYPQGLSFPANKTPLRVVYQPASRGIDPVQETVEHDGRPLPDVMVLKRPKQALQALADACMDDLDAYSRWVGRKPASRDALPGLAMLPKEILRDRQTPELERFVARLHQAVSGPEGGLLPASVLFDAWPSAQADRFSKAEAISLFQLLEALGYGIEPDLRFAAHRLALGLRVVLFPLPTDAPATASPEYTEATTLLFLAVQVSQADGVSAAEELHLAGLIEQRAELTPAERVRLRAYLRFLLSNPVDVRGLKQRLGSLPPAAAESVGDLLVGVVAADGRIDASEVQTLGRLFRALGLAETGLHRRLHAATLGTAPVTTATTQGIGASDERSRPARPSPVRIDPERLRQRQESTARVSAILQGVFADDDDETPPAPPPAAVAAPPRIDGLDAAHTAFFLELGARDCWDFDALAALAARHRLLLGGAIDRLNEAAYEHCDAPLLDSDGEYYELDCTTWETLHGQTA